MTVRNRTNWRAEGQRCFGVILGVLILCFATAELSAKPPAAADIPELAANLKPFDSYICGNSITVDGTIALDSSAAEKASSLIGPDSQILTFEENNRFLCATVQGADSSKLVRRIILIKPSTVIVDDVTEGAGPNRTMGWKLSCRKAPTRQKNQLAVADENGELTCSTLWPAKGVPSWTVTSQDTEPVQCGVEMKPAQGANAVRCLHVLSLDAKQDEAGPAKTTVTCKAGVLNVTVAAKGDTYRLELPRPGTDAGTVEITGADGKVVTQCRPLPSGVLPHGPEGMKLLERWDKHYRDGRWPPWNNDLPASPALQEAVEKGTIKPCRVVVLGCGSGQNAIFLAKNGFDVTAIEIAPTALGRGMADARKAGAKVRWVLADVLKLPDMKPFDLIFDRGCYHNVRYVDAAGFVASMKQLCRPKTRCFIISRNEGGPPGVREKTMRDDFSELFDFEWLRKETMHIGINGRRKFDAWSLMLSRKEEK